MTGYGGRQCYLSTAFGVGVAMGVPVALTVSASIVFFSLTVRTIRQSPKLTRSREDERHVWVYVKLSTITGATWALAFVVFFTKVSGSYTGQWESHRSYGVTRGQTGQGVTVFSRSHTGQFGSHR